MKLDLIGGNDPIDANLLYTPVVICDINCKVIYKNKAARLFSLPRIGAKMTSCLDKNGRNIYESVFHGSKKAATASFVTSKGQRRECVICKYKPYSEESVWLFPNCFPSVAIAADESMLGIFSDLSKRLEYLTSSSVRSARKKDLMSAIGVKMLERTFYQDGELKYSSLNVGSMIMIIEDFAYKLSRGCGRDLSVRCDSYARSGEYVYDPSGFLAAFLSMVGQLLAIDDQNDRMMIRIVLRQKAASFEIYANVPSNGESVSDYLFENNRFEMAVFSKLCGKLGWELDILPFSSPDGNAVIRMSIPYITGRERFRSPAVPISPAIVCAIFNEYILSEYM